MPNCSHNSLSFRLLLLSSVIGHRLLRRLNLSRGSSFIRNLTSRGSRGRGGLLLTGRGRGCLVLTGKLLGNLHLLHCCWWWHLLC